MLIARQWKTVKIKYIPAAKSTMAASMKMREAYVCDDIVAVGLESSAYRSKKRIY